MRLATKSWMIGLLHHCAYKIGHCATECGFMIKSRSPCSLTKSSRSSRLAVKNTQLFIRKRTLVQDSWLPKVCILYYLLQVCIADYVRLSRMLGACSLGIAMKLHFLVTKWWTNLLFIYNVSKTKFHSWVEHNCNYYSR